jgi:putative oxidoreductase
VVFVNAAWIKFGDMGMVLGYFSSMGISGPLAYFVCYAELIGGAAFILGIFVRYAGIILAIIMAVAIYMLSGNGFSLANGGYEYPLVLCLASVALVTMGAGKYSLAAKLRKK